MLPKLGIGQPGDMNLAYLGKIHRTGTVYSELRVEIDLAPDANHQLIARSEDIAGGDIHFA